MKILLSFLFLTFSSCFQSSKFDTCDRENEKLVRVDGGERCLSKCSKDSDCKGDDICTSSVCAPLGSILTISSFDKTDVGNDVGIKDTSDAPSISDEEADKVCAAFRQRAVECTESQCAESGIDLSEIAALAVAASDGDNCRSNFKENPLFRKSLGDIIALECANPIWKGLHCSVSLTTTCQTCQASTKVGDPCSNNDACRGGDFGSICAIGETGSEVRDGYCLATCSDSNPENEVSYFYENSEQCGEGNTCLVVVEESRRSGFCFKGCAAHAECRPGYICQSTHIDQGEIQRTCFPASECTSEGCKPLRCGKEAGPGGVEVSVCQVECRQGIEVLCTDAGGVCSAPDVEQKSYCVLP